MPYKIKTNLSLCTCEGVWRSGDIASLILNLSSQKEWSASFPMGPRADPKQCGEQWEMNHNSTVNHLVVASLVTELSHH